MMKGDIGGNPDMGSLYSLDTSEADLSSEAGFSTKLISVFRSGTGKIPGKLMDDIQDG